jgi:hypothetical protein
MKRNPNQHSIKASIAIAVALLAAALSGCASMGNWSYSNPQASLADFGGGGGDGGSSGDGGSGY